MRVLNHRAVSLFVLATVFLLAACAARQENMQNLDRALNLYHNLLQFKQVQEAADFVDPELNAEYYKVVEPRVEKTNQSGYQIRSVTMNEDESKAEVIIIREIYDNESFEVRTETIHQTWKKDGLKWFLAEGDF